MHQAVAITATGRSTPSWVMDNRELVGRYGLSVDDEWIFSRTGIRSRHWLPQGETTSDLAVRAAQACLDQAGLKATDIDLVLSGINLGENAGMSAVYSGTVAAAREGAMWGIPSLAVSVWRNEPARLSHAVEWLLRLLRKPALLPRRSEGGRPAALWNVNFPPCAPSEIRGASITSMSTARVMPARMPWSAERVTTRPSWVTIQALLEAPSVTNPSPPTYQASYAPFSRASCFASTLGSRDTDLISTRGQRFSGTVMTLIPLAAVCWFFA